MKIKTKAVCFFLGALFVYLIGFLSSASGQEVKNPLSTTHNTMLKEVEIVVTVDNYPHKEGLGTEWGFSCLVKGAEKTILFDTGSSDRTLLTNMQKLGVNPDQVELIVLSHEHADHTRGLQGFLQRNHNVSVYLPASFQKAFKEQVTEVGAKVVEVRDSLEICNGVYSVAFGHEQALLIHTDKGGVLITGCAHPGIVKMIKRAKEVSKSDVTVVMGGFHLKETVLNPISRKEIETIISSFKDLGVKYVGPAHCSGDEAKKLFEEAYKEQYLDLGTGKLILAEKLR